MTTRRRYPQRARVDYTTIGVTRAVKDYLIEHFYSPRKESRLIARAMKRSNDRLNTSRFAPHLPLDPEAAPLAFDHDITIKGRQFGLVGTIKFGHVDEVTGQIVMEGALYIATLEEAKEALQDYQRAPGDVE